MCPEKLPNSLFFDTRSAARPTLAGKTRDHASERAQTGEEPLEHKTQQSGRYPEAGFALCRKVSSSYTMLGDPLRDDPYWSTLSWIATSCNNKTCGHYMANLTE